MIFANAGYGTPFVEIHYNGSLSLGLTELVADFTYAYCDESGDECIIKLESARVDLADLPEVQEEVELTVIWGIMEDRGAQSKRIVRIVDTECSYTETGIALTLKCKDPASIISENSTDKNYSGWTALDMATDMALQNGLDLAYADGDLVTGVVVKGQTAASGARAEGKLNIREDFNNITPAYNTFVAVPLPNFMLQKTAPVGPLSNEAALTEALESDGSGNYKLDLRDKTITIRKRNFNIKPITTLYYRSDNDIIISFTPETERETRKSRDNGTSLSRWDSLNKEYVKGLVPKTVSGNGNGTELIMLGDALMAVKNKPLPTIKIKMNGTEQEITTWGDPTNLKANAPVKIPPSLTPQKLDFFDKLSSFLTGNGWPKSTSKTDLDSELDPLAKVMAGLETAGLINPDASAESEDDAFASLLQDSEEESLKTNPAKLITLGNSIFVSSKVITLLGLARKHCGNYYIAKAIHQVNNSEGWMVSMDLYRNATTFNGSPNQILARDFGIEVNNELGPVNSRPSYTIKSSQ